MENQQALMNSAVNELLTEAKWDSKLKKMPDLIASYRKSLEHSKTHRLDFSGWLPTLGRHIRPLHAGAVCTILANTGSGKTAAIQNLLMKAAKHLKTFFFEMEIPDSLMAERFLAIHTKRDAYAIERMFLDGTIIDLGTDFDHITFASEARFTLQDIEEIIRLKKPQLVILDYIGLIQTRGNSRYEKMSQIAEEIRLIATVNQTIILVACQVRRGDGDSGGEIFLHDAKDSGSIENSSSLMLGLWREGDKREDMKIKILKQTSGGNEDLIFPCHFNGANLNIYE